MLYRSFDWKRLLGTAGVLAIAIGCYFRFYHLNFPAEKIFDEVYFPVFAAQFLHGVQAFDTHPPLGKLLIAVGIWLFGDQAVGWRIVPAFFGVGLVGLCFWFGRQYFQSAWAGLLLAAFVAMEPIFVVYSRTGLMDGILVFFILATFLAGLATTKPKHLFLLSTLLGLSVAVKWIGLGTLLPLLYLMWQRKLVRQFLISLIWSAAVYLAVVCLGALIGHEKLTWQWIWNWHWQAYVYHRDLKATHPWSSPWWSWPLLLRPVLLYNQNTPEGQRLVMATMGNPLLWWSSTVAVLASLYTIGKSWWKKRRFPFASPLVPLLLAYFAFWLPWVDIHRVAFLYHYLPSYLFALCMLVYWLIYFWKEYHQAIALYVCLLLLVGGFYFPFVIATPLSSNWLSAHMWVVSWCTENTHEQPVPNWCR